MYSLSLSTCTLSLSLSCPPFPSKLNPTHLHARDQVMTKRPVVTNLVDWRHRNLSPQGVVLSRFATSEVAGGATD